MPHIHHGYFPYRLGSSVVTGKKEHVPYRCKIRIHHPSGIKGGLSGCFLMNFCSVNCCSDSVVMVSHINQQRSTRSSNSLESTQMDLSASIHLPKLYKWCNGCIDEKTHTPKGRAFEPVSGGPDGPEKVYRGASGPHCECLINTILAILFCNPTQLSPD